MGIDDKIDLYITGLTVANITYILRSQLGKEKVRETLHFLCSFIHIAPITENEIARTSLLRFAENLCKFYLKNACFFLKRRENAGNLIENCEIIWSFDEKKVLLHIVCYGCKTLMRATLIL